MAQIDGIGAGIYTSLAYTTASTSTIPTTASTITVVRGLQESALTQITGVREFPEFGVTANIVNVPVYGQRQSDQIQGQADAPTLEFSLNYDPSDHGALHALVGNGMDYVFRIRLANAPVPTPLVATTQLSDFYVVGRFAALTVNPELSDANQATLTISTTGDVIGPETNAAV